MKKAKSIMIQGTMSNAGKSLLCAGLCRVFHQDGYKVAPFKSQNMALNSFITKEGLEMGRAQVVQAEAAGVEPDVRMNPILLKPTSDVGSQVIVRGQVLSTMPAREYFAYKHKLIPSILEAYDSLAAENDIIVLEGAGSPAEINLKQQDIVNMGMARMAGAPVLLAGDIDRGGVFASLYGTVALLEEEERQRIRGLIVNKFRGDVEILRPGLSMVENLTRVPVVGVVPYLSVDIEEEDSLAARLDNETPALVDIAVIRLPRLSNFTDFAALERTQGVGVRYVSRAAQLGEPDLIILPGTKNTMGDLRWLRESGLEGAILKKESQGVPILGICGGYQMLGQVLRDPLGVEEGGSLRGLGLLPIETDFLPQKTRTQTQGRITKAQGFFAPLEGCAFQGYEIHMGETRHLSGDPAAALTGEGWEKQDGASQGNVLGTYVHGILDGGELAQKLISLLFARKGLDPQQVEQMDYKVYKEQQYDILADAIRRSLDMDKVYQILEEGAKEERP